MRIQKSSTIPFNFVFILDIIFKHAVEKEYNNEHITFIGEIYLDQKHYKTVYCWLSSFNNEVTFSKISNISLFLLISSKS
jgi:hypothetical protein